MKKLDEDDDEEDVSSDEQVSNSVHFVYRSDFYPLTTEETIRQIGSNFVSGDRDDSEPMLVDVNMNGAKINMKIDTGTYVTVISKKSFGENFRHAKIPPTSANLRGYDGRLMKPIGTVSKASVEFHGKRCVLDCFILTGTGPALIGRQWFSAFPCWPLRLGINDQKPSATG